MSPIEQYRALARYNRWMNRKLFALLAPVDDLARKRDRGAFFGSIHGTLSHVLLGDRIWMLRLTGDEARYVSRDPLGAPIAIRGLDHVVYPEFEALHRERERTDEDILAWTYTVDETTLDRPLEYSRRGEPVSHPTWWAVGQLFNHQTHHRGQVTTLLSQLGLAPGVTDLIAMLREEAIPVR